MGDGEGEKETSEAKKGTNERHQKGNERRSTREDGGEGEAKTWKAGAAEGGPGARAIMAKECGREH